MVKLDLEKIMNKVLEVSGVKRRELVAKDRHRYIVEARALFIVISVEHGYNPVQISAALDHAIDRSTLYHYIKSYTNLKDNGFIEKLNLCRHELNFNYEENYYLSMGTL
jgi:hypothetical protein